MTGRCRAAAAISAFGALGAILAWPGSAVAHIDPEPAEAPAGSELVVGFTVEHGCDGSPTVQLDMRLPAGVTAVAPEPIDGWTSSVDGDVVTFIGGPLPDDTPQTFRIRMTLPTAPGSTVYFPFVQRCETGEIRWIDIPTDGSGTELDEPAPAMTLTEPVPPPPAIVPASTTTVPLNPTVPTTTVPTPAVPTTAASPIAPNTIDEVAPTTDAGTAGSSTSGPSGPADGAGGDISDASPDTGSGAGSGGVWILVGSIVAVGVIGALALRQSRRARREDRR